MILWRFFGRFSQVSQLLLTSIVVPFLEFANRNKFNISVITKSCNWTAMIRHPMWPRPNCIRNRHVNDQWITNENFVIDTKKLIMMMMMSSSTNIYCNKLRIIIKTIYIIIRVTFPESFSLENFQCWITLLILSPWGYYIIWYLHSPWNIFDIKDTIVTS